MSNPMTPQALRQALDKLGLSQAAFARFLSMHPRSVAQWIADDARVPGPVALLLRYMIATGTSPHDVLAAIYAEPPATERAPTSP